MASTTSSLTLKQHQTWSYFSAFILLGMLLASLGPTLPFLAKQLSVSMGMVSWLFSARSLGCFVASLSVGHIYDRFAGHRVLMLALVGSSLGLFLTPFISNFWLIVGLFLLIGYIEGAIDIGGNSLLVWVHGTKVAPYMNALHFFFGLGAFFAPLLVAWLLRFDNSLFLIYGLMALLPLPLVFFLWGLESPRIVQSPKEDDTPMNKRFVFLVASVFFLYAGAEISFGGWIFSFSSLQNLASDEASAYLTSAFWLAFTIGRLISVPLANRLLPKTLMLYSFVLALIALLVMNVYTSYLSTFLVSLAVGLGMAAIFPSLLSFAERRMTLSAKVTARFFTGVSLAGMIVPLSIGYLIDSEGLSYQAIPLMIGSSMLLAFLIFLVLLRQPANKA